MVVMGREIEEVVEMLMLVKMVELSPEWSPETLSEMRRPALSLE